MRIELLLILPLLMAAGQDHTCQGGHNCNNGESGVQEQVQDQTQAQTQAAEQSQSAEGGNANLTSADSFTVRTDYKRNAPSVHAPSIHPTAPCIVTGGFGLSFPGGGGSLGGGKLDKGCEERETARMLAEMGAIDLSLAILCKSNAVERTVGEEECSAWVRPLELWYVHAPADATVLEESIAQHEELRQQQSTQIAELVEVIKRNERDRRQEILDKEERDRLWYEQLDELEQKYEVD